MIRVLHVLHSMNRGGAENAIMNYYRYIDRGRIQFDFLLTEQHKCCFEDEILSLGGRVYRVPLLTFRNPFAYLRGLGVFFKQHPDYKVVHSHTSSKSFFPLLIAKRYGVPIRICHSHNNKSETGYRGLIRNFLKVPLKRVSTHLFACSADAAKWLYGENPEKSIYIIPNVIDSQLSLFSLQERSSIRDSFSIKDTTTVIGCTARFSLQKNHSFLLSVFSFFHSKNPDSVLLLVGDGDLRNDILNRIQELSLTDCVFFAGVVSDPGRYYSAMDLFVLPSLYEGLGMVLVEAQVSGLRCFTSNGVAREVDKTGLVSFLSLDEGPEYWANYIISDIEYNRESHLLEIKDAGYDAATSSRHLQLLYQKFYSEIKDKV